MTSKTLSDRKQFGELLKKYRLVAGIQSLADFANLLADRKQVYETSLLSRWQSGERIPSRKALLAIIQVLFEHGAIHTIDAANELFELAGLGNLSDPEVQEVLSLATHIGDVSSVAKFGELIRSYRMQCNISQQELALHLGHQDADIVKQIESGKMTHPPRRMVDDIIQQLHIHKTASNELLLVGNYQPTQQEVEKIRQEVMSTLDAWPHSAVLYDFTWRIITINKPHATLLGMGPKDVRQMEEAKPFALDIVFDPEFVNNKYLEGKDLDMWHANLLRFVMHFRMHHRNVVHERWYRELIERLMKRELFRKVWQQANEASNIPMMTRHGVKTFYDKRHDRRILFNIFVVPIAHDPRFEIEFYSPAGEY